MLDPHTGEPAELLFCATDNRGKPGKFPYYRSASGHVFIGEIPANLGDYYEAGYQPIPQTEAELAAMAAPEAYRLDLIKRLVSLGDFLEIGPWVGLTAYNALKAGYRVYTLERDQRCVDLMNRVGINAEQTDNPAEQLRQSDKTYDVIGMWHSIEHLPRPWEVIDAAAKRLNPGGVLLIAGPNPESAQFRVLGNKWLHLDAPRHLHFLPAGMIEEIGRANGLETVERTTDDQLGRILDRDAWVWETHRMVRRTPIIRAIANRLLSRRLARKHRQPGAFDGAGYTVAMMRPA